MKLKSLVLLPILAITACSHHSFNERGPAGDLTKEQKEEQREMALYNKLFPYYAQVCVHTEFAKRTGKMDEKGEEIIDKGGRGGHATIFLKGACVQKNAALPQLEICDSSVDLADPDAGVGVSLNGSFINTVWVATPGRANFYGANMTTTDKLDNQEFERIVKAYAKSPTLKGIKIKDESFAKYLPGLKMTAEEVKRPENLAIYQELIARESIGTDYALSFARNSLCSRIPLPKDRFEKMVSYLNERNVEGREKGFVWNAMLNNCAHLTSNAFAAAGLYHFKTIWNVPSNSILKNVKIAGVLLMSGLKVLFNQMPDISIPANNVVRMAESSFEKKIDSAAMAWGDKDIRANMLTQHPWLSNSHGALLEFVPMKPKAFNDLYLEGLDPTVLHALFKPQHKKYNQYRDSKSTESLRYYQLEANLEYFSGRYKEILKNQDSEEAQYFRANQDGLNRGNFQKFYDNFYDKIHYLDGDVDKKLAEVKNSKK